MQISKNGGTAAQWFSWQSVGVVFLLGKKSGGLCVPRSGNHRWSFEKKVTPPRPHKNLNQGLFMPDFFYNATAKRKMSETLWCELFMLNSFHHHF